MISDDQYQEVIDLLADGELSRRQIGRKVGVSHSTVARIAMGAVRKPSDRLAGMSTRKAARPSKPHRCEKCGALIVTVQCIECLASSGKDKI